jgi:hypothetical protein
MTLLHLLLGRRKALLPPVSETVFLVDPADGAYLIDPADGAYLVAVMGDQTEPPE